MSRWCVVIVACLVFLFSCRSKSDAYDYNMAVIGKEAIYLPTLNHADKKIRVFQQQKKYDSISIMSAHVVTLIQTAIDELEAMPVPDVNKATELKNGTIRYYTFLKLAYTIYGEYGNAKTDEEREAVYGKLESEVLEKRQAVENEFRAVQKNYADENGFRINNPIPFRN